MKKTLSFIVLSLILSLSAFAGDIPAGGYQGCPNPEVNCHICADPQIPCRMSPDPEAAVKSSSLDLIAESISIVFHSIL